MSCSRRFGSFSRQLRSSRRIVGGTSVRSGSFFSTPASVSDIDSPANSRPPRDHLPQHDAERPDVRALVRGLALSPARAPCRLPCRRSCRRASRPGWPSGSARSASCRPPSQPARSMRAAERLRQAEVQHLHRPVVLHLDVGRLQVAVDDALVVRRLERRRRSARRWRATRPVGSGRPSADPPGSGHRPVPSRDSPARRHGAYRCWDGSARRWRVPRARIGRKRPRPRLSRRRRAPAGCRSRDRPPPFRLPRSSRRSRRARVWCQRPGSSKLVLTLPHFLEVGSVA